MKRANLISLGAIAIAAGVAVRRRLQARRARFDFRGRSIVITGGSRGLGLVMARQLARQGARLALLARDPEELDRAKAQLAQLGAEAIALSCDVRDQSEVTRAIERVVQQYGGVDVLINNAGVIQVGPFEQMTVADFEDALKIHLFGPLYGILAVLPHMQRASRGRIVNIASVGGKIAVPHLLPYCASKFALVGLSDGLRAELRRFGIRVTTVCPGLMRTGSPPRALFKGRHRREYAWFAISDSAPLLSMSAERAARRILSACRNGASRVVLGVHTKGAVLFNELFPGAMSRVLAVANRFLPDSPAEPSHQAHSGFESYSKAAPSWLTRLSRKAALGNNEL